MTLIRTMLRPIAALAAGKAARQVKEFLLAHRRTGEVQERLALDLVSRHAETAFGREHGFGSIRSWRDFTTAVPVRDYEGLRPWMDRVYHGDSAALLPPGENVLMFSLTSGTTGEPKRIPVTRAFLAQMRRGWNVFGLLALRDHPAAWLRPILTLASPMDEQRSPTGLPCGAISGLLAATQMRIVRRMYVAPPAAARIADPDAKCYTLLRYAVGRDVAMITTANPSSAIRLAESAAAHAERLIRDVRTGRFDPPGDVPAPLRRRFRPAPALAERMRQGAQRNGRLLPGHVWNVELLNNWTGGTLGLYLPRLRELFAGASVRDIGLLASEGRFSIPLADGAPAGVAEITGNVLEFIPAGEYGGGRPTVLRADQAEPGEEYFLVVTNCAGLWRYSIDDRVRVVRRMGGSPVFEFLSRGRHTASITGEKITERQVVEAMGLAARRTGVAIERFVLQGRFADVPYYELQAEPPAGEAAPTGPPDASAPPPLLQRVADEIDKALSELNMEYRSKRASGRLGPVRPRTLQPGTLRARDAEEVRRRRGRSEQYKPTYLRTDVLAAPAENADR